MTTQGLPPIVVDTSVVSYIYRAEPVAQPYLRRIVGHSPVISFQTYEELLFGVLIRNWGQRRINELFRYVNAEYAVVGYDSNLVETCARLRAESRRIGRELSAADAWIAATAVLLNCPLLSHDCDFGDLPGLQVVHCDSPADDTQH